MNYAISSDARHISSLETTARKRAIKHSLIHVEQGLALCRLGKIEYAIEPGQTFWIPIECLNALTFFPNTQIIRIDFSVRLQECFPRQAGFVTLTALAAAVLQRLKTTERDNTIYSHLSQILKAEVPDLVPNCPVSELTQQITSWKPNHPSDLNQEQHMVLLVREAIKRHQSGTSINSIISDLFQGDKDRFSQWSKVIADITW